MDNDDAEVGSHAGTLDLTSGADARNQNSSAAGYGGPVLIQIAGYVTIFVLIIIAIALGASAVQTSNAALALAESNEAAIMVTSQTMSQAVAEAVADIPIPSPPPPAPTAQAFPTPPVADDTAIPLPAADDVTTSTIIVTPPPTSSPTTDPPTETHPLDPKWFHTDHDMYTNIVNNEYNAEHHSHMLAGLFCHQQNMFLCPYDVYCPSGQGKTPFKGGPPKSSGWVDEKPMQWSPFKVNEAAMTVEGAAEFGMWVQVGSVPETDGGLDANGHGACWTWADWENGQGGDIVVALGEEHRSWILCCNAETVVPDSDP